LPTLAYSGVTWSTPVDSKLRSLLFEMWKITRTTSKCNGTDADAAESAECPVRSALVLSSLGPPAV
jgi:hypothetical protein